MVQQLPCVEYNEFEFRCVSHSEMNQCSNCRLHNSVDGVAVFFFVVVFNCRVIFFNVNNPLWSNPLVAWHKLKLMELVPMSTHVTIRQLRWKRKREKNIHTQNKDKTYKSAQKQRKCMAPTTNNRKDTTSCVENDQKECVHQNSFWKSAAATCRNNDTKMCHSMKIRSSPYLDF